MARRDVVAAEVIREIWRDVLWLYTALKPNRRPRSRGRLSRADVGHVPPPRPITGRTPT